MAQNDNVKGITIQIGGDVQPLNDALKEATKKTASFEKQLDSINKKLKLDPKNIDLLKEKQEILTDAIDETKKQVSDLHEAWKKASDAFKKGEISAEQFEEISKQTEKTEKKLDNFESQLRNVNKALEGTEEVSDDAADALEDLDEDTEDVTEGMDKMSLSSMAVASHLGDILKTVIDVAKQLREYLDAQDDLISSNNLLQDSVKTSRSTFQEQSRTMDTANDSLLIQINRIEELDRRLRNENLTEEDAEKIKTQLRKATEKFNEEAGASVITINEETGALKNSTAAGRKYIQQLRERAKYEANYNRLIEVYTQIYELEGQNERMQGKLNEAYEQGGIRLGYNELKYEKLINLNTLTIAGLQDEAAALEGTVSAYNEAELSVEGFADAETAALEESIKREEELHAKRLDLVRNTNNEINLSYETSLEERARILAHNKEIVENYEKNLAHLLEIALAQDDENAKQAMLNYISTLTDYSQESMAIVDQLVKDFGESGGDQAWALINGWNEADAPSEFKDIGVQIDKALAKGLESGKSEVTKAAEDVANALRSKLRNIKVSYTLSGSSAQNNWSFRPMAQGGIVTQPTYTLTGEAGPEAIIPLDRLGGIIESALDGSSVGGSYTMNVYPQSMSPSEQEMLLDKFDRRFGDRTSRRAI